MANPVLAREFRQQQGPIVWDDRMTGSGVMRAAFILLALNEYFDTFEAVTPDFVARIWLGDLYAAEHVFEGRTTDRLRSLLEYQCDRARTYYRRASAELPPGDARALVAGPPPGSAEQAYRSPLEQ